MSTTEILGGLAAAAMFVACLALIRRGPVPPPLPDLGSRETTIALLPRGAMQRKRRERNREA